MHPAPDTHAIDTLRRNLDALRATIAQAARRAGRDPAEITLVAVTKYAPESAIPALMQLGLRDFGESRVQALVARAERFGAAIASPAPGPPAPTSSGPLPRWHLIGHLQRNKVRALVPVARVLHSLDSLRLARELQSECERIGADVEAFVEVNIAGEASKGGLAPADLPPLLDELAALPNIRTLGLMTMAPYADDPELARPHFRRLRALQDECRAAGLGGPHFAQLSMGMSGDYAVAIEEGATFVRVGSALFEGHPTTDPRT